MPPDDQPPPIPTPPSRVDQLEADVAYYKQRARENDDEVIARLCEDAHLGKAGADVTAMPISSRVSQVLFAHLAATFDQIGAKNFVEVQLEREGRAFTVTVQRVTGKTPFQMRAEADELAQRLQDHLNATMAVLEDAYPQATVDEVHKYGEAHAKALNDLSPIVKLALQEVRDRIIGETPHLNTAFAMAVTEAGMNSIWVNVPGGRCPTLTHTLHRAIGIVVSDHIYHLNLKRSDAVKLPPVDTEGGG